MQNKAAEILALGQVEAVCGIGLALLRKSERDGIIALTVPEQHFYSIYRLDMDVNNGGFYSYFTNTAGDLAGVALAGLPRVGALHIHSLLQRAAAVFPGGVVPKSQGEREVFLGPTDRFKNTFAPLDTEYYDSDEPVIALVLAYAKKHIADFQVEGF